MSESDLRAESLTQEGRIAAGSAVIARQVLERVTRLVPAIRARTQQAEMLRRVPEETVRELAEAGVFRMAMPVEYGGYALTPGQMVPVFSEIARACGSTGWLAWLTTTGVHPATIYPHKFQAELFAPGWEGPLQSGAINHFAPATAQQVEGGVMIAGKWAWCSACHHTRFHILSAMLAHEDGRTESVTCQVPHEQIEILDDWHVMGMQGSGSNTIIIREAVFVPQHRVLPTATLYAGMRPDPRPAGLLFQLSFAQLGPVTIAALAIGLARAAIEELQRKAQGRAISFTFYKDQSQAPVTHLQLGEMHARLTACEATIQMAVREMEDGALAEIRPTPLDIARLRGAAAFVCHTAKEIADTALRAGGASSIQLSSPLQRIMRDATTISLHAQTNIETAYEDLGRQLSGLPGMNAPRTATGS